MEIAMPGDVGRDLGAVLRLDLSTATAYAAVDGNWGAIWGISVKSTERGNAELKIWKAMAAGAMTLSFVGVAAAQDLPVPDGGSFDRIVGAAGVLLPDYEGSDDYTFAPAPILQYKFGGERYLQIIGNKAFINVLDHPIFELGVKAVYRLGRDDVDDSAVDRMRDLDDSIELGGFVGFKQTFDNNIRHRVNVHLDVTQDVSNGHDGLVAQLAAVYWRPVTLPFDIGFRGNLTYASDNYMSSYFSVDADNSARSGLSQFSADSGMKDFGLSLMGLFHLSENWHIGGSIMYMRMLSDAEDSPVVDDRGSANQLFGGLALLYSW